MKGYYQIVEDNREIIDYRKGSTFKFPAHFHKKVEIFLLKKGEYEVNLNGKNFTLKGGDIAFFDCYDIHSYEAPKCKDIDGLVLIFPTYAIENFLEQKNGKKILNPIISNAELCEKIYDLSISFIVPSEYDNCVKSCTAELITSLLLPHFEFSKKTQADEISFAQDLLVYLNSNFQKDLSLKTLSKEFGYSPEHISRIFHRYLNVNLSDYVNKLRLDYLNKMLKNKKNIKITDLIFEAGFNSIQTYYRTKHKLSQDDK